MPASAAGPQAWDRPVERMVCAATHPLRRCQNARSRPESVVRSGVVLGIFGASGGPVTPLCRIRDVAAMAPLCSSPPMRSEEHTSELQSRFDLVCRLLLEKKNTHEDVSPLIET